MPATTSISGRVEKVIHHLTKSLGRERVPLQSTSDLHKDAGLSSDEGVMLVLDLCDEFAIELPEDFNAVVHDTGKRGRRFSELVSKIESSLQLQETTK